MIFSFETLLFSLCNSIPFFLIAYNREKSHFNLIKMQLKLHSYLLNLIFYTYYYKGLDFINTH